MPNIKFSQFNLDTYNTNDFVVGYDPTTNANVRIPVTALQQLIVLSTTGSSGSATLAGGALNIPTYTLSGLGGVPTTRTITINGNTQDLSANRSWTVPGILSLNGLSAGSQLFATGVNGTDFNIVSAGSTHTFNIPVASSSVTGKLSSSDWINFDAKQNALTLTTTGSSGSSSLVGSTLNVPTYTLSGLGGVPTSRTLTINGTAFDLSADRTWTIPAISSLNGLTAATQTFATGTTGTDFGISSVGSTHTFNLPTASATNRGALSSADWTTFNSKYGGSGTTNYVSKFTASSTIGDSQIFDNGTNVGIGNAAPTFKLDVSGAIKASNEIRVTNTVNAAVGVFSWGAFGGNNVTIGSTSNNTPLFFLLAGTPVMRLGAQNSITGSEGQLTIGNVSSSTAPWSATSYVLALGVSTSLENNNEGSTFYSYNTYRSAGGPRYIASNPALSFGLDFNKFVWKIAPSGTSGNLISFTDAMTLDSTGALGIGITSPSSKLDVNGDLKLATIINATTDTDRFIVSDGGVIKYRTGTELLSDIGAQGALTLTTTGNSGASTLISNTLNVPNYTISGLGGVPTGRTITINGTTQDLSADRTWTIPVAGTQTLDQTTALGNTSNQSIQLLGGAKLQTQNVTTSDLLNLTATGTGASTSVNFTYDTSGENLLAAQQQRLIWGSSLVNQVQFRAQNLTGPIALEMPNVAAGTPTVPISVNGVTANTAGDISIAVGGTQTLQQTTTLGNSTTDDIVLIDSSLTGIDTLEFDLTPATTAVAEGRVRWDDFNKTLQIDTENSGVSVTVGHELLQRVNNQTGATITKGKVVYINGQQGNRPTITLADNTSDATSATTFGIVAADINNNNNGYVITNGILSGINTSSYTSGQVLYLGTSGNLTPTKPVAPAHLVTVCKVITAAIIGSVYVEVQNGYELEELHDVLVTSPLDSQVLTFDSATTLWKNEFPARYYNFGFNNISDYVVNGGSGTQNLGAGTLGMSLFSRIEDLLTVQSGGNYNFSVIVSTNEQYGGVACDIGLRVTASSSAGGSTTDYVAAASRVGEFGSNYAVQRRAFTFTVPITISGAPTQIVKFEVLMNRATAGSTSVYLSQLIFVQP